VPVSKLKWEGDLLLILQANIQGVEHDLRQIEQIDSWLYNNEDTRRVIRELGSKYMNEQQQLCKLCFFKTGLLH